jgi:hypothetical protein
VSAVRCFAVRGYGLLAERSARESRATCNRALSWQSVKFERLSLMPRAPSHCDRCRARHLCSPTLRRDMTLNFPRLEIYIYLVVILIVSHMVGSGSSNWLLGSMLITCYL